MNRKWIPAGLILLVALPPLLPVLPDYWITLLNTIGLASLVVIGLVLLTGVGGMTSFGQAAFCGFGAYTTALLTTSLGLSPWLTLPIAILLTCAAAVVLGLLTVRLSGHFLPLGTLAWGISLYYLFGNLEFLGRHDGIPTVPPLSIGGWDFYDDRTVYYVIWSLTILAAVATLNLLDSRVGRSLRALKGGITAAESFGVNTRRAKLVTFVYAAFLAAVAGWAFAHVQRAVNPTPFGLGAGIDYLLMAVIGGVGHVWGAVLGAGAVILLKDQLQTLLPALFGHTGNYETIIFGVLLILLLQFARQGLWGLATRLPWGRLSFVGGLSPTGAPPPSSPSAASLSFPAPSSPTPAPLPALTKRHTPNPDAPLLEVDHVQKTFGGLMAVRDVAFTLAKGEIVALIGPNGAGKSTTFNLITGVLPPTAGAVRFQGRDITGANASEIAAMGMARSFQHVKLLPTMTVLENVMLGAHLRGKAGLARAILRRDRAEERSIRAEAMTQLDRCGLADLAQHQAGTLALGQSRVVEIARALCLDPALLLLDEPAAGLRHGEKQKLAALLTTLRAEGRSILLVEHDMDFVMNQVDRLVVMDFGAKIAEGTPDIIRDDPRVLEAYLGGIE
ncbi:MAG: branched-chain amino acid ABC transporter ATP-binding protein/permease [Rhodospirillum sp.]|nr:branched-chain amino acid ABC transporter ATP-binding protein/permease [Rhodospirillum sp.]MCF8489778.1 branched-chain amino acid ABC transporter ATP-binding protein/permease [Rhodospirillum sp.]